MRPAARGVTNDSPSSARCARGYGPLRERRRGAAEECRSKARNTPSEQQSVPKSSVCFARSDERVGLQRPVARAQLKSKWVKLRSSMSWPELRSHLRAEARGVA